jgi:hypothetical protein
VWICRHYLGIEKGKIDKTQGASSLNQKLAKKKKKKREMSPVPKSQK